MSFFPSLTLSLFPFKQSIILARPNLSRAPSLQSRMGMYVMTYWARIMSFFPSLTLSLFPFKQVHHLDQTQSLVRFFSAIENGHVCYELLSKNKHLVSTDYSLFYFVIALLNPYSHNSHPFLLHDFVFVQFPLSSCFISLLPFLFLHHDCCSLLLAFYSLLFKTVC